MADEVAEASIETATEAKLLRVFAEVAGYSVSRGRLICTMETHRVVKSIYRGDRCRVVNRFDPAAGNHQLSSRGG